MINETAYLYNHFSQRNGTSIYTVKIELSHLATPKDEPVEEGDKSSRTYDWTVNMRGVDGKDLSHIVDKVVFDLDRARNYPKPKRGETKWLKNCVSPKTLDEAS